MLELFRHADKPIKMPGGFPAISAPSRLRGQRADFVVDRGDRALDVPGSTPARITSGPGPDSDRTG